MHRTRLIAVALWAVGLLSTAFAQSNEPASPSARGSDLGVIRTEQELKVSIEVPALPSAQCEATSASEYQQRNTVARVATTLSIAACTAASGTFTVALRIRDEAGVEKQIEITETWQRSDSRDVKLTADYPIGEGAELVSARVRGLRCTCGDAPPAAPTN